MDNKQHQIFRLNVEEEQQAGREKSKKLSVIIFGVWGGLDYQPIVQHKRKQPY